MKRWRWFCLLLLVPGIAQAEIYKCTVNGKVVLQSSPCPGMAQEKTLPFFEPAPHRSFPVPAKTYITKTVTRHDAVACLLPHWRREWDSADRIAKQYYQEHKRCVVMRAGIEVSELDGSRFDPTAPKKVLLHTAQAKAEAWVGAFDLEQVKE